METRRTKHIWIACQNLVDSVIYGRRGGIDAEARKKPLASEVYQLKHTLVKEVEKKFVCFIIFEANS